MYPWDGTRRHQAVIQEEARMHEDSAARDREELRTTGGGFGFAIFIVALIFFKPMAEYLIELYTTIADFVRSLGAMIGL